jgi:hypothetical protein
MLLKQLRSPRAQPAKSRAGPSIAMSQLYGIFSSFVLLDHVLLHFRCKRQSIPLILNPIQKNRDVDLEMFQWFENTDYDMAAADRKQVSLLYV